MFVLQVNKAVCSKCLKCIAICANSNVLIEDVDGFPKHENVHKCISCGHCIAICPDGAISVTDYQEADKDMRVAKKIPFNPVSIEPGQLFQALCGIRSNRFFLNKEVEKDKVSTILDAMLYAPSAGNEQNRSYHVYDDSKILENMEIDITKENEKNLKIMNNTLIRNTMIKSLIKHSGYAYRLYDRNVSKEELRKKAEDTIDELTLDRPGFFLKGSPVVIFVTSDISKKGMHKDFYKSDAEIAITYATIIAASLGLSCCRLGLAEILINRSKILRGKYSVGKNEKINGMLALGYSDTEWHAIPPRGPSIVRYN